MTWIESSVQWADGIGPVPMWTVIDAEGRRLARFLQREDAEAWLLEELRLKEQDYYCEEAPRDVDY